MMLMSVPIASNYQKSHAAPHLTYICSGANDNIISITDPNGVTWPKSHAAHHFDHLDLRNTTGPSMELWHNVIPMLMSMLWHEKGKSCTSFQLPRCKKCNGGIFDTIGIMWCQQQCQCYTSFWLTWLYKCSGNIDDAIGITWPKMSCCISFWISWPNKMNGAFADTVSNMWPWHKHQWHYMTKSYVAHCFHHLDLMNTTVLLTMPLTSHEANANAKHQNDWKKSSCTLFWSYWTNNCYGVVDDAISFMSCEAHTGANSITWPKSHVTPCLNCPHLMNKMMPLMMQLA